MRITELEESYKKYGALYPVIKDKNGEIVDGFHRKRVDKEWPEIEMKNIDTPLKREIFAFISNINRREITGEEITNRLDKIADILIKKEGLIPESGVIPKRIAELIGRGETFVRKYLSEKYVADYIKSSHSEESISSTIYVYNVWQSTGKRLKGYGYPNFHGNTPPIVIIQCLSKYTERGDLVLDPMAGSGTTIDVCKKMNRKILAFDVKSIRKDIKFSDAEDLKLEDNSIDFIFAHWPYWNMTKYSKKEGDLSNMTLDKFIMKSERIMGKFHRLLKPNKYFALLIGDKRERELLDLSGRLSFSGSKFFTLFDKIIWVAKNQRSLKRTGKNLSEWRAKIGGYCQPTFDVLLVFKKVK